jgi:hypothetical protein
MRVRAGAIVCLVVMSVAGASGRASAQAPAGSSAATGGDPAAQTEWQSVIDLFSKASDDLNAADRGLAGFVAANKLTPGGAAATKSLAARNDAARTNLASSLDAAKLLAGRPTTTAADAARFRSANLAAVTEANASTQASNAATQNAAFVDHSDADRAAAAQRAADAAAARAAAAQAASDAQQAAAQARKDAQAQAQQAQAQAQSAADAKIRADVDAKTGVVVQAIKDQGDICKQASATLDALLIKNNLTSDARNTGIRLQRRIDASGANRLVVAGKISSLGDKPAAQAATMLAGATADVNVLGREVTAIQAETRALAASPRTFIGGIVPSINASGATDSSSPTPAPAGSPRTSDIVPVCDFTFEPADGKPMQIAIDGGPVRPLPTHARLASGRHLLSIHRGADAADRRELLLCGYVSTVPIEPITH